MSEYGGIFAEDQATGTTTNIVTGIGSTAWTKVMAFNNLMPANGVSVNHGVDELQMQGEGVYRAFANLSIFGQLNDELEFVILRNDLETDIKSDVYIGTTGATSPVPISLEGFIDVDAGDRIALGVQVASGSNRVITVHQGALGIHRVS